MWAELFERAFTENYETIHRRETSQLRNNAQFWGHMLSSDAISWQVMSVISLNEDDTTSSSRIFIKILIQAIVEALGMKEVQTRFTDEIMRPSFAGLFPLDNARNTRFAINYFTSIGMGHLTEQMRDHIKNAPKPTAPVVITKAESDTDSSSSYSSYSSYSGSSRSYSTSRSPSRTRDRRELDRDRQRRYPRSRSPSPSRRVAGNRRDRSYTRSPSPMPRSNGRGRPNGSRRRSRSPSFSSRSPSPRRARRRSRSFSSRSRSPPRRRIQGRRDRSISRSRSPPRRGQRPH